MRTEAAAKPEPRLLPRAASVAAFALLAGLVATAMPLVAYAGSLALFGLPHVLAELRYVDGRFGRRLPGSQVAALVGLLGLAVGLRAVGLHGRCLHDFSDSLPCQPLHVAGPRPEASASAKLLHPVFQAIAEQPVQRKGRNPLARLSTNSRK